MRRRAVLVGSLGLPATPFTLSTQSTPGVNPDTLAARAELVRGWEEEASGRGDVELVHALASPDYVSPTAGNAPGVDALVERQTQIFESRAAQVDSYSIEGASAVAQGDEVAVRTTITAERQGRIATVLGFGWYLFDDSNLVISAWGMINEPDLASQLYQPHGTLPRPPGA